MPQCTSQGRPSAPPVECAEPGSPPPLSHAPDGRCAEVEAARAAVSANGLLAALEHDGHRVALVCLCTASRELMLPLLFLWMC